MKRVVSSSFIALFIILLIAAAFFYFRNFRVSGGDPVKAIPADAAFFLAFDATSDKLPSLLDIEYRGMLEKVPALDSLYNRLSFFDSLYRKNDSFNNFMGSTPLYISVHVTGAGNFDFLFLKSVEDQKKFDQLVEALPSVTGPPTRRNYDGNIIYEVPCNHGRILSYCTTKGIAMASFTPFLVEDALRQLKVGKPVTKNFESLSAAATRSGLEMYVNFNNLPSLLAVIADPGSASVLQSIRSFATWGAAGIKAGKSSVTFEGSLQDDDTLHFSYLLTGQKPVSKKMLEILPRKTAFINYYGLSDFKSYYERLSAYQQKSSLKLQRTKTLGDIEKKYKINIENKFLELIDGEYALIITSPSGYNFENNSFAIFRKSADQNAASVLKALSKVVDSKTGNKTMEESYNGQSIGLLRLTGVLPVLFGESFNKINKMYYTIIGDYIIFGNQASSVRAFIDDQKSGMLLVKTDFFKESVKEFSPQANRFIYCKPSLSRYLFKSLANNNWKTRIDTYKDILAGITTFTFQVGVVNNKNEMQASLNFTRYKAEEGVSQVFAVEADSSVTTKPLLTTDPVSQTRQILFQDETGDLVMTDNNGNKIWVQPVDGKIISEIFEIDLFRNNSRQFLFNTATYMYLLDAQGKPVGNYPIRLPASATNGLAVFDFDRNRDSKIYIACANRRIYAYQASGRPLPGWNFQQNTGTVTDPVRLVTIGGKELLMINDREGGVLMVNRFGEIALPLSQSFVMAKNSTIYSDSTGLVTTDPFGSVIRINTTGLVEIIPLNVAGPDHGFMYADADNDGEKDFLFADGKDVTAYNKSLAMIYRKVFDEEITGPIYEASLGGNSKALAVQSYTSNKTWLLKTNGSIYPGFPVKGNGPLVIDELNLDGNKNLITGSSDGHLYVYRLE